MKGVPMHRLAPDGAPLEDVLDRIAGLVREHDLQPFELDDATQADAPAGIEVDLPSVVAKLRARGAMVRTFIRVQPREIWLTIVDGDRSYYCNASPLAAG